MGKQGFTLVELLTVVAIIGILLTLATLDFGTWTRKYNKEAQVRQMYADFVTAQVEALHKKRRHNITVNSNQYVVRSYESDSDTVGTVVMQKTLKSPIIAASALPLGVTFDTRGFSRYSSPTPLAICLSDNDSTLAVDAIIISDIKINEAKRNSGEGVLVRTVFSSNDGFTMIEVLVAMVIMMVGLVGLLQSINIATEHNIRNYLRDEAVRIGDEKMRDDVVLPFTAISSNNGAFTITRNIRTGSKTFAVMRTVTNLPASGTVTSKKVDISIRWSFKGKSYQHNIYRIVAQ